jgi:hypothetical protein
MPVGDFIQFNAHRQNLLKIKTSADETILFTKEEAKAALITYISEELELFAEIVSKERKKELEDRINYKLKHIETNMFEHIEKKIDRISEEIALRILDRKVNEEVDKRVEAKLEKIKNSL